MQHGEGRVVSARHVVVGVSGLRRSGIFVRVLKGDLSPLRTGGIRVINRLSCIPQAREVPVDLAVGSALSLVALDLLQLKRNSRVFPRIALRFLLRS